MFRIPVIFGWRVFGAFSLRAQSLSSIDPFLKEHCLHCHNDKKQKGDFRLDTLSRDFASGGDAELWFEVVTRIGAGEMPPEDESQPSAESSNQVMEWIAARIKEGEAARMAKRAPVTLSRLSRDEYAHTAADLLGVHYDTRAPGAFTEDPDWHGFERLGSELSLSPSHVEKYLKAATEIIDLAFPDAPPRQTKDKRDALAIEPDQLARLTRSDAFNFEQFAYFLDRLAEVKDGEGSFLDTTLSLYGSGMAYGHSHGNANLPTVVAGGRKLGLKHGRHVDFNVGNFDGYALGEDGNLQNAHYGICSRPVNEKARLSNLLVTLAQKLDVETETFADSLGTISEIES